MGRWGLLLLAILISAVSAIWSWSQWSAARQSLLEVAAWRNQVRLSESQLTTLQSQQDALEFVVPGESDTLVYQQILKSQQKAGVTFTVERFQLQPIKEISDYTIGRFRGLAFTGTMKQMTELVEALETPQPYWLSVERLSIKPGDQVEQGQPELMKFEFDLECIVATEPAGS